MKPFHYLLLSISFLAPLTGKEKDPFVQLSEMSVNEYKISEKNIFEITGRFSERFSLMVSVDSALIDFYLVSSLDRFAENSLLSKRSFYFDDTNALSALREVAYNFGLAPTNIAFDKHGKVRLIPLGWGEFFGYLNEKIFIDDVFKENDSAVTTIETALGIFELRARYSLFNLDFIGFDSFDPDILQTEITVEGDTNTIDHLLREIARITNSNILYTGSELILVNKGERE